MRNPLLVPLALVAALLALPTQASPAPKADKAGVKAVFGGGSTPPTHKDNGEKWEKNFDVPGKGKMKVWLSYGDTACAKGRVYEDHDAMKLPNGVYTWIVTMDGVTSFGHPIDAWEIGTRHAHLAHGRKVVAAGEARKSNSELRLNILSGTFSIPMVKEGMVPNATTLEKRVVTWFDEVQRAKYGWAKSQGIKLEKSPTSDQYDTYGWTKGREKIFDGHLEEPTKSGLKALCGCSAFAKNNAPVCK